MPAAPHAPKIQSNEAALISNERQEILQRLAELSERRPDVRFGQLVVNLSYLARGPEAQSIWDMEDDELLAAAEKLLASSEPVARPVG